MKVRLPLFRNSVGRIGCDTQAAANDVDVHPAIVVIVGLHAVQSAQLAGQSWPRRSELRTAAPGVVEQIHGTRRIERRDRNVQQAVIVEVLHDGAARLSKLINSDQVPDIVELANVEFALAKVIVERNQEPRIDAVWILAQSHVSQVE